MFRKITLFAFLIISNSIGAQIAGISASKLSAFHVPTVPKHTVEFEPTYSSFFSDTEYKRVSTVKSDSTTVSSSLCWRITYGLTDKVELGINLPSDVSYGSFSFKTPILEREILSLGVMAGLGIPLGNRTYNTSQPGIDDIMTYGVGLIGSIQIDSSSSLDLNIQMTDYFRSVKETISLPFPNPPFISRELTGTTFYANVDYGSTFLSDQVVTVLGLGYSTLAIEDYWEANLFLEAGISLEWNPRCMLVLAGYYSVYGVNMPKSNGMSLTLTTVW